MMNFLDLSTASEEERRLIKEILSDTSANTSGAGGADDSCSNNITISNGNSSVSNGNIITSNGNNGAHDHTKNQAYHPQPQDNSNNLQNHDSASQSMPAPSQPLPHMPGDMNSVIGMKMASTQAQGYAIPPPHHVTAFGPPPPHHVYSGPPIYTSYHYMIHPYNPMPSFVPYVLTQNSVVQTRPQIPPQSNQSPNSNSHHRPHSHHVLHHQLHPHQHQHQHHQHHQAHHQQQTHESTNTNLTHGMTNYEHHPNKDELNRDSGPMVRHRQSFKKKHSEKEAHDYKKVLPELKTTVSEHTVENNSDSLDLQSNTLNNTPSNGSSVEIDTPSIDTKTNTTTSISTKIRSSEQCVVIDADDPVKLANSSNNDRAYNNILRNGHSLANKNKSVLSNTRHDRIENLSQKGENSSQAPITPTKNQPQIRNSSLDNPQEDFTKNQDVLGTLTSSIKINGDETVKHSSYEVPENQSSLNVHKQSHEPPIQVLDNANKPSSTDTIKSSRDTTESSDSKSVVAQRNSNAWGSASSKSWASLFKSGGQLLQSSAIYGDTVLTTSASEHSDEESKLQLSSSSTVEPTTQVNCLADSTKELRSQEAAKRSLDKMAPKLAHKIRSINLKHSLPFLKPRGFINKGNGCYINATLQALIACPPFYNLMKEIGVCKRENSCTPILDSFADLFLNFPPLDASKKTKQLPNPPDQKMNINYLQAEAIEPKCIYNVLGQIKSECLKGAQEDAEEFLSSVLNGLHEEMIGLGDTIPDLATQNGHQADIDDLNDDINNDDNLWREVGPKNRSLPIRSAKVINTPVQEIFGGSLFSIRTAGKDRCGHRSPFFSLQLDISGDNVKSVQDAIKSFTATEIIHDFYCSKTKQKLDAQRRTSLDQLPPILILHLKQFVYTQDHGLRKLIKKIEYPIDFELPENCLHERNSIDKNLKTSRSYKLLAVVYHDGKEAIKGHYLTDVYHIGSSQWIRCDDSNLKVIPSPRIENPDSARTPYLLFYRRHNTLRAQTGNHDNKKKS